MYLLFFIILASVFLSTPYLIHSQFRSIYENEKQWIQLDNASIELGQKDRALLNELEEIKNSLKTLERLHHPLHLCKTCQAKDFLIELRLRYLISRAQQLLSIEWPKNFAQFSSQVVFAKKFLRKPLPIQLAPCSICELSTKIIYSDIPIQSQLGSNYVLLRKNLEKWNYEIKTETNGHYSF